MTFKMKFSSRIFLILFFALSAVQLSAQRLTAHRGTVSNAYNYWFYVPGADPSPGTVTVRADRLQPDTVAVDEALSDTTEAAPVQIARKPLVIFLHGASLCGRNLSKVRRYGTIDALARGLKLDAYVMAPQNPGGAWNPHRINRIVDWAIDHYSIDTTRIYVLGMSLGGYGTIDYAAHSPQRVAAAIALCGGGTSRTLGNLNQLPLVILHGTADKAVSWQASQGVVNAMRAAGDTTRLIYRLLPGQSHGALAHYFYVPSVYEWLFEHSLTDSARTVCRDYNFDISITENCYRRLTKPTKPLTVDDSSGGNTRTGRTEDDAYISGVHVVRRGDTLGRIARQHRTTVSHLCQVNHISRTSTLHIGQKIRY